MELEKEKVSALGNWKKRKCYPSFWGVRLDNQLLLEKEEYSEYEECENFMVEGRKTKTSQRVD